MCTGRACRLGLGCKLHEDSCLSARKRLDDHSSGNRYSYHWRACVRRHPRTAKCTRWAVRKCANVMLPRPSPSQASEVRERLHATNSVLNHGRTTLVFSLLFAITSCLLKHQSRQDACQSRQDASRHCCDLGCDAIQETNETC